MTIKGTGYKNYNKGAKHIVKKENTLKNIETYWDDWYVKGLGDFVRVPNLTPRVDEEYLNNGLIQKAIDCVDGYVNKLELDGISKEIY